MLQPALGGKGGQNKAIAWKTKHTEKNMVH